VKPLEKPVLQHDPLVGMGVDRVKADSQREEFSGEVGDQLKVSDRDGIVVRVRDWESDRREADRPVDNLCESRELYGRENKVPPMGIGKICELDETRSVVNHLVLAHVALERVRRVLRVHPGASGVV
jgi:hypothetical protein